MHRHRRRLRRFLGHEHERRRCQLRTLVGFVVEEPRRPPRQVASALDGDRDVGQRMRDALQRRDRHAERVAGLGELGGDGHRLLDETDQRCRGEHAPFIQCPLIFGERLRSAAQHGAVVGGGGIDPCHRQPADVVDLDRSGPERQADDVVTVAHDDVVGDRPGRDQAHPGHVVVSRIERDQLLTVDDVRLDRAEPCQQSCRADVVDPRDRGERAADSSATSVRSTSVAPSPPTDSGSAMLVAPMAHSRSHRLLSKPDSSAARTVSIGQCVLKNCLIRRLYRLVVLGQAVVQPPQFVTVHRHCSSRGPKKKSCRVVVEVVVQHVGRQVQRQRLGHHAAAFSAPASPRRRSPCRVRGCACSATGCPAAASATTPMSSGAGSCT